jgi:O-antigen/teichoic acid export membrane protein
MKRILQHTFVLTLGIVISRLLNLGFRYLAARALSVEDYGRVALALGAINYGTVLATFNLGNASARFLGPLAAEERPRFLRDLRRLGSVTVLTGVAGVVAVLGWLGYPPLLLVVAGAGVVAYTLTNVGEGTLRAFDLSRVQAANQVLMGSTRLVLLALLLLVLPAAVGTRSVATLFVVGFAAGAAFVWTNVLLRLPELFSRGGETTPRFLREAMRYGAFLSLADLATSGVGFGNRLIVVGNASFQEVSHYDNALLFYSAFQTLLSSYVAVSVPYYSRQDSTDTYTAISWKRVLALFVPAWLALYAVEAIGWVPGLFGALGVASYAPMYPIFLVLVLGFPAEFLYVSVSGPLQARGEVHRVAAASVSAAAGSLLVAAVLVPRVGAAGAAISSLVNALLLGVSAVVLRHVSGIRMKAV